MIRSARLLLCLALFAAPSIAAAQHATSAVKSRTASKKKSAAKKAPEAAAHTAEVKPNLVGTYGSWGAYTTAGHNPTCYVLSQPEQRVPPSLKRDAAYVFISTRPAEHVRNEVSIVMGFDIKNDEADPALASIGKASFDMVAKGPDLWLKDETQDGAMIAALKRGDKLVVKAASMRGNVTTDSYSLKGLTQALENALKSCK